LALAASGETMSGRNESPFTRWSRLKRRGLDDGEPRAHFRPPAQSACSVSLEEEHDKVAPISADQVARDRLEASAAQSERTLPDPTTLTRESDFTVFLQQDVPEEAHRAGLRALWRSDPLLANLDGLNDYDEDMRHVGTVEQVVKTAYRVGRGYLDGETETASADVGPLDVSSGAAAGASMAEEAITEVDAPQATATYDVEDKDKDSLTTEANSHQDRSS
jgi:Protein of unknown function (DUF3306)